jgi:sigma-B regulation protein RsbU (phosphoserine phosphatase)
MEHTPTAEPRSVEPSPDEKIRILLSTLDVSCQLAAMSDLQPLLERIAWSARQVLDCEGASVFLHDPGVHELYSLVATEAAGIRFSANQGIAGEVFRTGRIINVPDAYRDPRFNQQIDRQTGFRTRSILSSPLLGWDNNILGVLQVLNKREGVFQAWDEVLVRLFSALAGVAIQRQMLFEEYRKKQQFEHDMALAREIQQGLFPKRPPEVAGFEVAGWNQPADETGGDFYDFQTLRSGNLAVILADVAGHGIGPALVVSECRALIRATLVQTELLDQLASAVNGLLCQDIPSHCFVTVFFGVLNPAESQLRYLSAGHGPLLFYRAATEELRELGVHGCPLGFDSELDYDAPSTLEFTSGDLLVVLTDGFQEWTNAHQQQFGLARVAACIRRWHDRPAGELIRAIHEEVLEFGAGSQQRDDLTAVVLKKH